MVVGARRGKADAHQLESSPCVADTRHLEQNELRSAKRVDVLQRDGRDDARDEPAPHHVALVAKREGV